MSPLPGLKRTPNFTQTLVFLTLGENALITMIKYQPCNTWSISNYLVIVTKNSYSLVRRFKYMPMGL